jgi:hypothetical protein
MKKVKIVDLVALSEYVAESLEDCKDECARLVFTECNINRSGDGYVKCGTVQGMLYGSSSWPEGTVPMQIANIW